MMLPARDWYWTLNRTLICRILPLHETNNRPSNNVNIQFTVSCKFKLCLVFGHPYTVGHCESLSYDSNNMTLDYFLYENVRQHRLYRNVGALTAIPISFYFFQQWLIVWCLGRLMSEALCILISAHKWNPAGINAIKQNLWQYGLHALTLTEMCFFFLILRFEGCICRQNQCLIILVEVWIKTRPAGMIMTRITQG